MPNVAAIRHPREGAGDGAAVGGQGTGAVTAWQRRVLAVAARAIPARYRDEVLAVLRQRPVAIPLFLRVTGGALALILCAASLAAGTYNPFIYFHF